MKQTEYRSLGIDVKLNTPETVAEFDTLAKRTNACLDEATNNVVYRGMLAEYRETFCERIELETKIERKWKVAMKDGKPVLKDGQEVTHWDETEADYFKRVCAEKKVEPSVYQSLADEVAASLVFDPTERERKERGPVKLAKMYVEKATEVLTQGRHEKVIQHIQKDLKDTVPVPVLADGDTEEVKTKNINALGHYIKAHISWKEKNSVAKY
jgi:hypothetical protein